MGGGILRSFGKLKTVEGSATLNLPLGNIAMRSGVGIITREAIIRNIRFMRLYVESDR